MFTEESVSEAELFEGLEDYCLNKAMDEAKDSSLLDCAAALEFLEEQQIVPVSVLILHNSFRSSVKMPLLAIKRNLE